jgi:hypothetical protein
MARPCLRPTLRPPRGREVAMIRTISFWTSAFANVTNPNRRRKLGKPWVRWVASPSFWWPPWPSRCPYLSFCQGLAKSEDVVKATLPFSFETLQGAANKRSAVRAVVAQGTEVWVKRCCPTEVRVAARDRPVAARQERRVDPRVHDVASRRRVVQGLGAIL